MPCPTPPSSTTPIRSSSENKMEYTRRKKPATISHAINHPSLPPTINSPENPSHSKENPASSGRTNSENVRSYKNSRVNAVEVSSCTSQADKKSYAAGKTMKKEDDIKNICYATNDKPENKEDMDDNHKIKEVKSDKEDKKMKIKRITS